MKVDILAIGVHPDDVELGCSGTLLRHIHQGKTVGILDLTRGELGTRGNAIIRTQEAMAAAKLIGAKERIQLDLGDGFFSHNRESMVEIIKVIRYFQPTIVLCNARQDRHPDHGRASKLTTDACFFSGLSKIETFFRDNAQPQKKWRPKAVYHYTQDRALYPDIVVDVTDFMDKRLEILACFKSQFYDPNSKEHQTPISSKAFWEYTKAQLRVFGRYIGVPFGEGFTVDRPVGVGNLLELT